MQRASSYLPLATLGVASSAFFLYRLGDLPIYLWDEARVAVNALEMAQSGDLLVTTYDGAPDLWNTKPPLAIWLEAASLKLFGISEFALRLPSAAAAIITTLIVYAFTSRVSGSRVAGAMAALVLMGCFGYSGVHVARTADYDALLVLFTTAAIQSLWCALEQDQLRPRWMIAVGVAVALAVLTKGVVGLMIGPGLLLYLLLRRRLTEVARSPWTWVAAAIALGPPLIYCLARDAAGPGYLQAMAQNDLGVRFSQSIAGGSPKPWFFYLLTLSLPPMLQLSASAFPWFLTLPFAAYLATRANVESSIRSAAVLCVSVLAMFLLVISAAATRVAWYAAPIYPLIAILTGLAVHAVWSTNRFGLDRLRPSLKRVVPLSLAVGVVWLVVERNDAIISQSASHPETRSAAVARRAIAESPSGAPIRLIHDGTGEVNGVPYVGPSTFYAKSARAAGRDVEVASSSYRPVRGDVIAWCDGDVRKPVKASGMVFGEAGGCRAVSVTR